MPKTSICQPGIIAEVFKPCVQQSGAPCRGQGTSACPLDSQVGDFCVPDRPSFTLLEVTVTCVSTLSLSVLCIQVCASSKIAGGRAGVRMNCYVGSWQHKPFWESCPSSVSHMELPCPGTPFLSPVLLQFAPVLHRVDLGTFLKVEREVGASDSVERWQWEIFGTILESRVCWVPSNCVRDVVKLSSIAAYFSL